MTAPLRVLGEDLSLYPTQASNASTSLENGALGIGKKVPCRFGGGCAKKVKQKFVEQKNQNATRVIMHEVENSRFSKLNAV